MKIPHFWSKIFASAWLFWLCASLPLLAQQGQDLTLKKTQIGDKIKMSVAAALTLLKANANPSAGVSIRKPVANQLATFQDARQRAEFVVSETNTPWSDKDVKLLHSFYKSNIRALYDNVTFSKEAVEKIGGKEFSVFEFTSEVEKDDIFSQIERQNQKEASKTKPANANNSLNAPEEGNANTTGQNGGKEQKPAIRKYTYIQYTVSQQKVYVFSFTCALRDKELWNSTVARMMRTVKFSEK